MEKHPSDFSVHQWGREILYMEKDESFGSRIESAVQYNPFQPFPQSQSFSFPTGHCGQPFSSVGVDCSSSALSTGEGVQFHMGSITKPTRAGRTIYKAKRAMVKAR